ncbi:MAG: hypothetical protein D6751_09420 [Deltaproteobacteria bacterium]|nr:MAG: hypothetical protein D6751_09420 [Deltaproteobacteria bacterium]
MTENRFDLSFWLYALHDPEIDKVVVSGNRLLLQNQKCTHSDPARPERAASQQIFGYREKCGMGEQCVLDIGCLGKGYCHCCSFHLF